MRFYIKEIKSLNNYELVIKLFTDNYDSCRDCFNGAPETWEFQKAVKYYDEHGCDEIVRALYDIAKNYV